MSSIPEDDTDYPDAGRARRAWGLGAFDEDRAPDAPAGRESCWWRRRDYSLDRITSLL